MKSSKRKNKILLLILLLLGLSIGFAALSTTLKIDGSTILKKNIWNIYWDSESINMTSGSKGNTIPIVENDTDGSVNTKLSWSVSLDLPGDFYEFTIDAVNAGTLDAMITNINETLPASLPSYIRYSVTYDNGITPAKRHILPKKNGSILTRQKYKIRVEVLDSMTSEDLANIPEGGISYTFNYEITYGQADDSAYPVGNFFETASWDNIVNEYRNGDPDGMLEHDMENNVTKTITIDDGTPDGLQARLRIANLSTPNECDDPDFSQTACGFVLEFADYLGQHVYNPYDWDYFYSHDYKPKFANGAYGGWEHSDLRAYLNGTKYLPGQADEVDYASTGFINTLPDDLRSKIINTKVISGHGKQDPNNFVTIDKLYVLDPREIWGVSFNNSYCTANNQQRQLDYYYVHGVTTTDNKEYVEKNDIVIGENPWWGWCRSAYYEWESNVYDIDYYSSPNNARSDDIASFSSAFRIAE